MKNSRTLRYFGGLLILVFASVAHAAPKSDLWPFWNSSDEANTSQISHTNWQTLLDTYLVQDGEYTLFQYRNVSDASRKKLQNYIDTLSKLDPRTYSKAEQYAYWVNLYNAATVEIILEDYPVKSITKLGGLFSFGPWDQDVVSIAGKKLTLNDIEHRILRPIWQDPRTHYVVNCASLGCPNLLPQALTSANTEVSLESAAKAFINSEKGVSLKGKKLQLSSIYDWFAVDFGQSEQEILRHIQKYRTGGQLTDWSGKIKYDYDWSLNERR
ncbi:hypothetical protein CS022_09985 [Veronia nyctiphanis]|uniref:DUF547 domain-containing protein n=1 Tax=Veronia nyctiphanis TaxID=1278244 RepID=A0A4Q0YWI3_9GAMM|nr:DUF547 domain-containing protein [Veronia nyctiphanis]RXJ73381.1 hypothetical protein CS022_09985 [Veronia nyctiphanis]